MWLLASRGNQTSKSKLCNAMGAHGTLDDALRNVAAFSSFAADPAAKEQHLRVEKRKKEKKKKSKSEKRSKNKKESKSKKSKKRHSTTDSSSSDLSDVDTLEQQLARGREAVRLTRELLMRHPGLKQDIREVLLLFVKGQFLVDGLDLQISK